MIEKLRNLWEITWAFAATLFFCGVCLCIAIGYGPTAAEEFWSGRSGF